MTETITIIAAAGPAAERAIVADWTSAGLLRDSVWVDLADPGLTGGNLLEMPVTHVTTGGGAAVPLRQVYGESRYDLVRVVALRPITADQPGDEPMADLWQFTDSLKGKLGARTTLRRINLVVPDGTDVWTKQLLEPDCDINVIVSPEDRPREGAIDHGLYDEETFRAHAALACSLVAGLWRQTDRGAFDQLDGHHGRVVVTRGMARAVDGRSLPERTVDRLMRQGVASLNQERPPDPNRAANDETVIDAAVRAFLPIEDDALSYRKRRGKVVAPGKMLVGKTLRMLMRFSLQVLKIRMLEWQQTGVMVLADTAEEWLQRSFGSGDIRNGRVVTADEMRSVAMDAPVGLLPGTVPVQQYLWSPLRRLCFSLVDGGNLPAELEKQWNTLHPGVSDPGMVAPSPRADLEFDRDERAILDDIDLPVNRIQATDVNARAALHQRLTALAMATDDVPEKVRAFRDRVAKWLASRQEDRSLVAQLAEHVHKEIGEAHNDILRRHAEYVLDQKERDELIKALDPIRGRLSSHMWGMLVAGLSLGGWLVSSLLTPVPQWVVMILVGITVVTGGYSTLWTLVLAARAAVIERDLHAVDARLQASIAVIERWPTEVDRLTSVYYVLLDWAEVIGWMLHEPYGEAVGASGASVSAAPRPEAFRVARPEVTDEQFDDVIRDVTKDVFGNGWITQLYVTVRESVLPDPEGRDDSQVDPDKSPGPGPGSQVDDPNRPRHARAKLLWEFRLGNCGAVAKGELTERIRTALRRQPPENVMPMVTVVDRARAAAGDPMSTMDFLAAVLPDPAEDAPSQPLASTVFSDEGLINGRTSVDRVYLWGPFDELANSSLFVPTHDRIVTKGTDQAKLPYQMSVVRLDVSAGCDETELQLSTEDSR